ncbi:MutS protein 5 [Spathaspora sp. JA1]|nr:MutS protein 5 [Spathaspora sp. JA1]
MEEVSSQDAQPVEELSQETILSIDIKGSTIGASCLDISNKNLLIWEDFQICNPVDYIEAMVDETKPSTIYVCSRVSQNVLTRLEQMSSDLGISVHIKIVADYTKFDRELLMNSLSTNNVINLEIMRSAIKSPTFKLTLGSINAIWLGVESFIHPMVGGFTSLVSSLEFVNFKQHVFIDVDSIYALQILPPPLRKNQIRGKTKKSLYDLVNYTVTTEGSKMLKDWVRKPLTSIEKIKQRQYVINKLSNKEIRKQIQVNIKKMNNVPNNLNGIKSGKMNWKNWKVIINFLQHSIKLHRLICELFLDNDIENIPVNIIPIFDDYSQEFQNLLNLILEFIEVITSEEDGKVRINNGIDQELDNLRLVYNDLDRILQDTAKIVSERYSNEQINAVYIPQLGFLISKDEDINLVGESLVPTEWQEVFRTTTNVYYKTDEVVNLDSQYGDIYELICDREIEIIHQLQERLLEYEEMIVKISSSAITLDCLCSLAEISHSNNYVCPTITETDALEIIQGRHPLVETCSEMFVANDTVLSNQERILVVTGANLSGKSVYLSQIGLIVVLAQIGCYIPAQSAIIGIFDKILTRIMSRESLEKQQSTFAIDLHQLSRCVSLSTDRSLLIIDEFGKGTDSIDSSALFGGALKYFATMEKPPRCIFSTHFQELFKQNELKVEFESPVYKFVSMEILLQKRGEEYEDNITYLYNVKSGVTNQSFGIYCAKECGIKPEIISRAQDIAKMLDNGVDLILELTKLTEIEEQEFSKAKSVVSKFLGIQFEEELSEQELIDYMINFEQSFTT